MATAKEILALRRVIDDAVAPFDYTDEDLTARLDAEGSTLESVAALVWREKAGSYASLVNVSESGSSRNLSDLRKAALEQAAYYDNLVAFSVAAIANRPRTRRIVRPTL